MTPRAKRISANLWESTQTANDGAICHGYGKTALEAMNKASECVLTHEAVMGQKRGVKCFLGT